MGNKLDSDLYVKPTDSHQYLDPKSSHPTHCIESIPYSQALRLDCICSEISFFDNLNIKESEKQTSRRHYC